MVVVKSTSIVLSTMYCIKSNEEIYETSGERLRIRVRSGDESNKEEKGNKKRFLHMY